MRVQAAPAGPAFFSSGPPARRCQRNAGALRSRQAQQLPAHQVEVRQRAGREQSVAVLLQPAVAHLGKAEDALDDPDVSGNSKIPTCGKRKLPTLLFEEGKR